MTTKSESDAPPAVAAPAAESGEGPEDAATPNALAPDAVVPDAVAPDAVVPDAVAPDAVAPDAALPARPARPMPRGLRRGLWIGTAMVLLALPIAVASRHRPAPAGEASGRLVFSDDFERAVVGDQYRQGPPDPGWSPSEWRIVDGRLRAERIHNGALWLQTPLPERVRVEFDARAESETGDVKCEIFGDGRTHQSGYILIQGGWNNSINCIARQDEHAEERKQDNRCLPRGAERRAVCVNPEVDYRWTIIRTDHVVRWYLDGQLFLTYPDADPVRGRFFAFNNWEAPVTFDNLRIYDLDGE